MQKTKQGVLLLIIIMLAGIPAFSQYTTYGKIEYERKVNLHRQIEDMMDEGSKNWLERVKQQIPKFSTSYFDYSFTLNNSLYKPGRETENVTKGMFGNAPAAANIVYTDFKAKKVSAYKEVFEEKFLVQDSMRKIDWKIEDEIRMIANYKCRKAVGRICDTVYVVAFYTEDIMVSGGPEMFGNLPGLILELAVPRLYSTWTATKVDVVQPKAEDIKATEKGKKVSQKELYEALMASISKWGKWAERSIWWSML